MQVGIVQNRQYINQSVAFKAQLSGISRYLFEYSEPRDKREAPDKFLFQELASLGKKPEDIYVLDLGAGQGRNTIPLAQKGYNVTAIEVTKQGCDSILAEAKAANLSSKVEVMQANVLDSLPVPKEHFSFAFMSHMSQHLSPEELKQALMVAKEHLVSGGKVVFDALLRKNPNYKKYDVIPSAMTKSRYKSLGDYGAASFDGRDIVNACTQADLRFVRRDKFIEIGKRAWYEHQNLWGGFRVLDYFEGFLRKPVELNWFVFRK